MTSADIFDFVVVGAGSAGCVIANRLSADANNSVAILEAGGTDWNPIYRMTFLAGRLYRWSVNNWVYHSEPQKQLGGRNIYLPRGKMLGGSFIFNGAVYIRGHRYDYDHWRELGNVGWSYADVLPYFKRSEDYEDGENLFHGAGGPLAVRHARPLNPLSEAFINAAVEAGHLPNRDFNGPTQDGAGPFDHNVRDGKRCTTAAGFLRPARNRPNLHIESRAHATCILVKEGRAVGVEFRQGGRSRQIFARREIVLSGGAINTPQLLMLSGIGDAHELQQRGIEVVRHLPGVGQNLQDHLNVVLGYRSKRPVSVVGALRLDRVAANIAAGLMGKGPFSRGVLEAGCFFRTRPDVPAPDCQVAFTPIYGPVARMWYPWERISANPLIDHSLGICLWPNRPESRGLVRLRSNDPMDAPAIDPCYLSAEYDLVTTRLAFKQMRRVATQRAFDAFCGDELAPGIDVSGDDEIDDWVRATGASGHHLCGTAKMGHDTMAVVDDQLRVHGVDGLRVADASIMPTMDSGNTNAPTIMIAEKASDMILGRTLRPEDRVLSKDGLEVKKDGIVHASSPATSH